MKIVLVDPNPQLRRGLRDILEEAGFELIGESVNGDDALNRVAA